MVRRLLAVTQQARCVSARCTRSGLRPPIQLPRYFSSAADDSEDLFKRGLAHMMGRDGKPRDAAAAVQCWEESATNGNVRAQNALGGLYLVNKNDADEASKWFLMAAKQGHSRSALEIGKLYLKSADKTDREEGLEWLHKACDWGSAAAALELGHTYCAGVHLDDGEVAIASDANKGRSFLKQAAGLVEGKETGDLFKEVALEAENSLGDLYVKAPEPIEQDFLAASAHYRHAAEGGHPRAQFNLASMIALGRAGPDCDDIEAAKWFFLAAQHGFQEAQFIMGQWYEQGRGVKQDKEEAEKYYEAAAKQGFAPAQHALDALTQP